MSAIWIAELTRSPHAETIHCSDQKPLMTITRLPAKNSPAKQKMNRYKTFECVFVFWKAFINSLFRMQRYKRLTQKSNSLISIKIDLSIHNKSIKNNLNVCLLIKLFSLSLHPLCAISVETVSDTLRYRNVKH